MLFNVNELRLASHHSNIRPVDIREFLKQLVLDFVLIVDLELHLRLWFLLGFLFLGLWVGLYLGCLFVRSLSRVTL